MAYKTTTISKMMQGIDRRQIYLPAIQRKFVWKIEQIPRLMDSIMHGYPFGTFLFWKIEKLDGVNEHEYALYEFIRSYDESIDDNNKLVKLPLEVTKDDPEATITAVLDGQQRLTSLCIVLNGGIKVKTRGNGRNHVTYVTKDLYFDLRTPVYVSAEQNVTGIDEKYNEDNDEDEENGVVTRIKAFEFLTQAEADSQNASGEHFWYRVKDVMGYPDVVSLTTKIRQWDDISAGNLIKLFQKIKNEELINYFEIDDRTSMDEVLDIFVRVNSAGTVLSKTDLLFSTVVATWGHGREEFDELLKQINGIGNHYDFKNDFLLRVSLYIMNLPTALKVEWLTQPNVKKIKDDWEKIKAAIVDTVYLLDKLGFNGENIYSYNAIVPVVYYRYWFGQDAFADDAVNFEIRKYIVLAHLNQIFGRSTNSALSLIRSEIDKHIRAKEKFHLSWLQAIKFTGAVTLTCSRETIEKWFDDFEKGPQTFMVLSLLYPDLRYGQVSFHQDHMHPYAEFNNEKVLMGLALPGGATMTRDKIKAWKHQRNTLANLQLLEGGENQSKNDISLKKWLSIPKNEKAAKYLPESISLDLENFDEFLEERRKLMIAELEKILL